MISSPWLNVNVAGPFKASEVQGSVAVATPNHHCDREAEGCCQCRPGKGEQHVLDHLDEEILPRVLDLKTKSPQLS